jgi:hypothetical protein
MRREMPSGPAGRADEPPARRQHRRDRRLRERPAAASQRAAARRAAPGAPSRRGGPGRLRRLRALLHDPVRVRTLRGKRRRRPPGSHPGDRGDRRSARRPGERGLPSRRRAGGREPLRVGLGAGIAAVRSSRTPSRRRRRGPSGPAGPAGTGAAGSTGIPGRTGTAGRVPGGSRRLPGEAAGGCPGARRRSPHHERRAAARARRLRLGGPRGRRADRLRERRHGGSCQRPRPRLLRGRSRPPESHRAGGDGRAGAVARGVPRAFRLLGQRLHGARGVAGGTGGHRRSRRLHRGCRRSAIRAGSALVSAHGGDHAPVRRERGRSPAHRERGRPARRARGGRHPHRSRAFRSRGLDEAGGGLRRVDGAGRGSGSRGHEGPHRLLGNALPHGSPAEGLAPSEAAPAPEPLPEGSAPEPERLDEAR